MVKPFSSEMFVKDPFFLQQDNTSSGFVTVTPKTAPVGYASAADLPCVSRQGLDPIRDGALIQRGGVWYVVAVMAYLWEQAFGSANFPHAHDKMVVDGAELDVDCYERSGDMFIIKAIYRQRAKR